MATRASVSRAFCPVAFIPGIADRVITRRSRKRIDHVRLIPERWIAAICCASSGSKARTRMSISPGRRNRTRSGPYGCQCDDEIFDRTRRVIGKDQDPRSAGTRDQIEPQIKLCIDALNKRLTLKEIIEDIGVCGRRAGQFGDAAQAARSPKPDSSARTEKATRLAYWSAARAQRYQPHKQAGSTTNRLQRTEWRPNGVPAARPGPGHRVVKTPRRPLLPARAQDATAQDAVGATSGGRLLWRGSA